MARRIIGELIESGELSQKAKNISFNDGILYNYNQDAYVKLVDAMEKDGKACAIRATGTGKMYLAIKWLNDNPDKPFVYVAPTNVILNKFVDGLIEVYFPKNADKLKKLALEDEIKYLEQNLGFDLHLYTYAKIHRMSTEEMEKVNASHIVLDEFHRCGADKWGKSVNEFLRINSNAKVMGLSATPIRPSDGKNMVEEMFDGKMASELTLVDALEQNILPLPVMVNAIYSFEDEIVSLQSQLANKKYDPEKKKEIDKTLKQVKQLIGQSGGVKAIFEDFIEELTRNKGKQDIKMVVFCKDIADRDRKMDECRNWFAKGTKIKKYSVTSKESEKLIEVEDDLEESGKSKKLHQKVIKTFEEDNSKGVKLLFAVDMLNEGLHVKNLDGVIMLRDTSSNIVFLQQLGRALAVDKDRTTPPLVFDLVNNIEVLGEDIEEYQEIIHRLTENGKLPERLRHHVDFEIQSQIIDLIQYLKDISYTFEDRIAPLVAYYKEFGTIANIITGGENVTKYEFDGRDYNLGVLISVLREEYGKGKLEQNEIDLLESMNMVWDKRDFYYRIAPLQAYYKEFGTIADIKTNYDNPIKYEFDGKVYNLTNLITMLRKDYHKNKLEAGQVAILEKMGMSWGKVLVDENDVRTCIKEFAEKYILFVSTYHKQPQAGGEFASEDALYQLWKKYTDDENLKNDNERQYLINKGINIRKKIKINDNVRRCVKDFTERYLEFLCTYHRAPRFKGKVEGESSLYSLLQKYTNRKNLQGAEEEYLKSNGLEMREIEEVVDNVRHCVKKFVKDFLTFVEKHHKLPQPTGAEDDEFEIYSAWIKYINLDNLKGEEEKQYIISNMEFHEFDHVRLDIKRFVYRYLKFVNTYGRKPQSGGNLDKEKSLYALWAKYTNSKNLESEEEKYLISKGFEIRASKKREFVEEGEIRSIVKEFIKDYLEFIDTYNKHPQQRGILPNENGLYLRWLKYTDPSNINEKEKEYLISNGINIREIKTKKSTPAPSGENFGQ